MSLPPLPRFGLSASIPSLAAVLLLLAPSAHAQTQNICERRGAWRPVYQGGPTTLCDLSNRGLTSLSSEDFDGLSKLTHLYLYSNRLTALPEDIFSGLSNLREIDFSNNRLTSLSENIFDGLSNLENIVITENPITRLPEDIFDGLPKLNRIRMGRLKIVCLPKIPSNLTYGFTGRSRTAQLPSCSKVTTLTVSGGLAVTEGENASFTLRINPAPSNPVTVNINVADADKANVDFDTSAANVDFLDSRDEGDKTVTIPVSGTLVYTVNTVDDNIDEPEGRVAVSVQNNNGYVSDVLSTAWVLVKDNDATTVTLRTPDATVIKGSTTNTARIALTLNRTLRAERVAPALTPRAQRWSRDWWVKYYYGTKWWRREELKVPLGFTGGTLGTDFTLSLDGNPAGVTLSDGVVTFPGSPKGSSRTATVVLSVPADAAIINDRIMVSIPSSTSGSPALTADVLGGGATGSLDGNGEIVVSDGVRVQEVEVNVTTAAKGVIEGGNVTFAITATPPPTAELPVSVTVTAVGDYGISAGSRTVTIPTSGGATLTLSTTDDMTDESDGSATLTLDTGASYTIGANSSQTVTIKDNNERRQSICYRTRLMDQTIITHLGLLRTPEQYCALDTHQITSLNEDAFSGLSDSLQIIDLWNNSLTSLPENVFDGFLNLNAIYLRHNLLTSLPEDVFDGLSNLVWLKLFNNRLTSLPEDAFDGLSNLTELYLQNNNLTSLPENIFDGLSDLNVLALHNNKLTILPENIFDDLSSLKSLYLHGNDLICRPRIPSGVDVGHAISQLPLCVDGPQVNITSAAGGAEGDNVTFTITATPPPTAELPVSVTVTTVGDYGISTGSQTVTIPTSGSATLTLSTTDDEVDENDGSVTVTLEAGTGYTVGTRSSGTVPITDNDVTTQQQQVDSEDTNPYGAYAGLIADVRGYAEETESGEEHVKRWQRVLKALGEDDAVFAGLTPMTASEAQTYADRGWTRWEPVVTALTALEAAAQPPVQPTITIAGGSAVTEGGDVTFTLTADPVPAANLAVTVSVTESGNVASSGATGTRTVTIGTGGTVDFTVSTEDDAIDEPDGSIAATVTAGTGYTVGSTATASVVVRDDDVPTITIAGGSAVTEGGDVTFTLTADPVPAASLPVTVSVSENGNFAASGATGARTVTIGTGGTVDFTVATEDDATDEADGSIAATVTAGTGYTVGSVATASVAVADNDVPPPEVNITSAAGGSEGADVTFVITATPAPTAALPVSVTVTAVGEYGISAGARTVSIPTGGSFTLRLSTTDDTVDEEDGSVTLTVEAGAGYTVGELSSQTASITDDDVATQQQQTDSEDNNPVQTQNICERHDAFVSDPKIIATYEAWFGNTFSDDTICGLSNKGITSLNSNDFNGLSNLQVLSLDFSGLTSLPEDVFSGLSSLQVISPLRCSPAMVRSMPTAGAALNRPVTASTTCWETVRPKRPSHAAGMGSLLRIVPTPTPSAISTSAKYTVSM